MSCAAVPGRTHDGQGPAVCWRTDIVAQGLEDSLTVSQAADYVLTKSNTRKSSTGMLHHHHPPHGTPAPSAISHQPGAAFGRRVPHAIRRRLVDAHATRRDVFLGLAPCCCSLCGRNPLYDQYFASAMAYSMDDYEAAIAPVKRDLFGALGQSLRNRTAPGYAPRLLEVGIGTGPNMSYYAPEGSGAGAALSLGVVGIDPNPVMLEFAARNAEAAGLASSVRLLQGTADALPFPDASFDAVVITLVLCSVPDPQAALAEARRVLKAEGQLLLIEHVASRNLGIRAVQSVLTPLQQLLADGCSLNRDTLASVRKAGFETDGVRQFEVDGFTLIAPHIAGLLRR